MALDVIPVLHSEVIPARHSDMLSDYNLHPDSAKILLETLVYLEQKCKAGD